MNIEKDHGPEQEKNKDNFEALENKIEPGAVVDDLSVPPQYEGLPLDLLEEVWTIPIYVDPEKNKIEHEKREKVLESLRKEQTKIEEAEKKGTSRLEDLEKVRENLGIGENEKIDDGEKDEYGNFRLKKGETDTGVWWNEYGNQIAKEMKESGDFEWGKERIYFDVSFVDITKLRDLMMKISGQEKIPVAFKYLDTEKTFDSQIDGKETRFVANFANQEDAMRLYSFLKENEEYKSLVSDREQSYGGFRIDSLAEYANGFRETRSALQRIMNGSLNSEGKWEWKVDGNKKETTKENYEMLKAKYEELKSKQEETNQKWETEINSADQNGNTDESVEKLTEDNVEALEDMTDLERELATLSKENMIIVHQTMGEDARKIVLEHDYFGEKSGIEGMSTGLLVEEVMGLPSKLDRQARTAGVHKGSDAMVVAAFPRSMLGGRLSKGVAAAEEALIDMNVEGKTKKLGLPNQQVFGYYHAGKFYKNPKFNPDYLESL